MRGRGCLQRSRQLCCWNRRLVGGEGGGWLWGGGLARGLVLGAQVALVVLVRWLGGAAQGFLARGIAPSLESESDRK